MLGSAVQLVGENLNLVPSLMCGLPIPLLTTLARLAKNQLDKANENIQKKRASRLSTLVPLAIHGDIVATKTAITLTYRYQSSIDQLAKEKDIDVLAKCAIARIFKWLLIEKIQLPLTDEQNQPIEDNLNLLVKQFTEAVIYADEVNKEWEWLDIALPFTDQEVTFRDGHKHSEDSVFKSYFEPRNIQHD